MTETQLMVGVSTTTDQNELATVRQLMADNESLRRDLRDAELVMREITDEFHSEQRHELRELQRELDNTTRDCRLLHFKLRKAERQNEDLRVECEAMEQQMMSLNDELCQLKRDTSSRVERLKSELDTAKQVSIRLHDECERLDAQCQFYRLQTQHEHEPTNILTKTHSVGSDHHTIHLQQHDVDRSCCQTATSQYVQQQLASVRRQLAESLSENDDLLNAVCYLRSKLPSGSHDASSQTQYSSNGHACNNCDTLKLTSSPVAASAVTVEKRTDLERELERVMEEKYELQCELAGARQETSTMLDTLRHKEHQFAEERKLVERKNKELSDVFDLFAERSGLALQRRQHCIAVAPRKHQLHDVIRSCRSKDDVTTQTDDVVMDLTAEIQLRDQIKSLQYASEQKDETIKQQGAILRSQEADLVSLETVVSTTRSQLADTERRLAVTLSELELQQLTSTACINGQHGRKLFDVPVEHVTSSCSPVPVDADDDTDNAAAVLDTISGDERAADTTSSTDVIRRRRRDETRVVPTSFRRSRSLSEMEVVGPTQKSPRAACLLAPSSSCDASPVARHTSATVSHQQSTVTPGSLRPYPRPPPNMIIGHRVTTTRSMSAERAAPAALPPPILAKRPSDVDDDNVVSGRVRDSRDDQRDNDEDRAVDGSSVLSRWATTLAFFRRRSRRFSKSKNKPVSASTADVTNMPLVASCLSQSQPLQPESARSTMSRIVDPLRRRRRQVNAPTPLTSHSNASVSSTGPWQRGRHSGLIVSAYMQDSL